MRFLLVRIAVRVPAAHAVFFVGPANGADGATRREAEFLEQADRLPGDDHATGVVHGALANVPRVDVAAHHHDLVGLLAAPQLAHHVMTLRVG